MKTLKNVLWTAATLVGLALVLVPAPAAADICHLDDVIIDGSLCVGFDCVCNMSFGFDTIVLKENNLRIFFDDTSVAASFPKNDWRIRINDSANGGGSYFAVEDSTGGRTPFRVDAGARANALYVDSQGDVGIGTSTPAVELHAVRGDTPTLRLEQDGSSGFTPQTWDLAGNETNFFVRDVTNGSTLPLRIRPSAPSSSIFIDTDGDVGIGTASLGTMNDGSDASLHVNRTDGDGSVLIQDTNSDTPKDMLELRATAATQINFGLAPLNAVWQWQANANQMTFTKLGSGGAEMTLAAGGDMTLLGQIFTEAGATCELGCDRVFQPEYEVESIEEHAEYMWQNSHLLGVGPTPEQGTVSLNRMTGGMLNELEKAHIYIEQLHKRLEALEARLDTSEGDAQ